MAILRRPLPFTVDYLRTGSLYGIPLTVTDRTGRVHRYTDDMIEQRIRSAVSRFERHLKVDLWPRKVLCRPEITHPTAVLGTDYDIAEDPLDYEAATYYANGFLRLRRYPVMSLERIQLRFPADQELLTYPMNWLRLNHRQGHVNILAISGNTAPVIIGREGGYLPLLTGQLLRTSYPQLIYADYTSGIDFANEATRDYWEDLYLALEWQATADILADLGRGTFPGVSSQSLSQDGQSQSVSYSRTKGGLYGNEIADLQEKVNQFFVDFRQAVVGIKFHVV